MNHTASAIRMSATTPMPAPMPAFAPVLRPESDGVGVGMDDEVCCEPVLVPDLVPDAEPPPPKSRLVDPVTVLPSPLVTPVVILLPNKLRSFSWYSTVMG